MERVNQSDLTARVANKLGLPMTTAKDVVDNFVDEMQDALLRGRRVSLSGFVSLGVRRRRARMGRNPKSGEPVKVPAGRKLYMKTSSKFKDDLDQPKSARKVATKAPAKKRQPSKKTATKKAGAKKATKKAPAKKKVIKKTSPKKVVAKKRVAKKTVARKAPAKKRPVKKAPAKKRSAKRTTATSSPKKRVAKRAAKKTPSKKKAKR